MKKMNDRAADLVRVRHMLDAAKEAIQFFAGKSETDLALDRMLTLSLIKEIEIIGEAANKISEAFKEKNPKVPWDVLIGIRHRMIHAYFDVDLQILWNTVTRDLPPLCETLEKILKN